MRKKLQIFISSTYTDLLNERQAAVEAILRAGNIPAGMELFSAGNKSQLETIKRWIDESDIYVLILGGRYGSLEPESQISYTEIEYRYALELEKPFFALVLNEKMLDAKVKNEGKEILELNNPDKFKAFQKLVLSKVCRFCNDISDIKLGILESIIDIQNKHDLLGWIKGDEIPDNSILLNELDILRKEKEDLSSKLEQIENVKSKTNKNRTIGEYSYDEILKVLESERFTVPAALSKTGKEIQSNVLSSFLKNTGALTSGVTSTYANESQRFLMKNVVPTLLNFGLLERKHTKNASLKIEYDRFVLSVLGNKFLSIYKLKNSK